MSDEPNGKQKRRSIWKVNTMKKKHQKPNRWMPLDVGDYMADTTHLDTEQHGAYLLLLMTYWKQMGPLPDVDAWLASVAKMTVKKWKKIRPIIQEFFVIRDGKWHQKRADAEIARALEVTRIRSEVGTLGAAAAQERRQAAIAPAIAAPDGVEKPAEAARQRITEYTIDNNKETLREHSTTPPAGDAPARSQAQIVQSILAEGCAKLGVRLEADTSRFSWPGEIIRLLEQGCTEGQIMHAFSKAVERQDGASVKIGYIASIARRLRDEDADERARPRQQQRAQTGPSVAVVGPDADQDRALVRLFRERGIWPDSTKGARPDQPGCTVDPDVLAEFGYGPKARAA